MTDSKHFNGKIYPKASRIQLHETYKESRENSKQKISFVLPQLNRDQQINLGQSIVALIAVNLPHYLSDQDNKEDVGLMFIDILKHFDISIKDLYEMDLIENVLDPDFSYELESELSFKILEKKEL